MSKVNGEPGFTQYTKLNITKEGKLLVNGVPVQVGSVPVEDEGVEVVANPDAINFKGNGVVAADNAGTADVTIPHITCISNVPPFTTVVDPISLNFQGNIVLQDIAGVATLTVLNVAVRDEGTPIIGSATGINFIGNGVSAVDNLNTADVTIPHVPVEDEGVQVVADPTAINFIGPGVTAVNNAGVADVTISAGSDTHVPVEEEGVQVVANPDAINFISQNLTAVDNANIADVTLTDDPQFDTVGVGVAPTGFLANFSSTTLGVKINSMTNGEIVTASLADGVVVYDSTREKMTFMNDGIEGGLAVESDGEAQFAEPRFRVTGGNVFFSANTNFRGGVFYTGSGQKFNRVWVNVSAYSAGETAAILYYQNQTGAALPQLVGTISLFDPGGNGANVATPSENPVILVPGPYYVMWGRDSGGSSYSLEGYTSPNYPLMNGTLVQTGQAPLTFTTTVAATTSPPATFDFKIGGPNGVAGAASTNTGLSLRHNLV